MTYSTLVKTSELAAHLDNPEWAVVDCRFSLTDAEQGRNSYLQGHIPGAVYAHLNEDLSSPVLPGVTGRHPLPEVDELAKRFSGWGIEGGVQVVAYDDLGQGGLGSAARLWWLLRWLGHEAVAVLQGGWAVWQGENRPRRTGVESRSPRRFTPRLQARLVAEAEEVERIRLDPAYRLLDARGVDRYRGENETIDPVAGHIPGAVSAPYMDNFEADGRFRPAEELRERFNGLLGKVLAEKTVVYCGSGVTATYNLLALVHAGLGEARLYPGSWSEWITKLERPTAR